MPDHQLKIYVGGSKFGDQRESNIRALALKYFPRPSGKEGNISALYNAALNKVYRLDPDTGEELGHDDIGIVADETRRPKNIRGNSDIPKSRK